MENRIIGRKYQTGLISDEVQELMSFRPHWIIRNGNILFFLIFSLLLASTALIGYPDIIRGTMKLSAVKAPKLVLTKTEGKLEKLLIRNEQQVKVGQPLAFLQSTALHDQVLALLCWINNVEPFIMKDSFEILLRIPLPVFNQLGETQNAYQDFQNTVKETLQILANGYYQLKKKSLLVDEIYLVAINDNAKEQQKLLQQDYELQQIEYRANESLAKDKVIAPIELNQNKSKVILKEQGLQQMAAQIINENIALHDKKKEILELQKYISDQQQKFHSELLNLKSKIEEWIQEYVILAPENGKVLFISFLQENQLLFAGQELFFVQPKESNYYGQLMVSQTGLGKIKIGQKVLMRLESYPSSEFGYLTGTVNYISNMPTAKDSFLIRVDFPKGLRTNYNKTIYFRDNLIAQAEVMTDDRKLFDRFIGQLQDITKR